MDTYVIATNNGHKLQEIRDILENDQRLAFFQKALASRNAGV